MPSLGAGTSVVAYLCGHRPYLHLLGGAGADGLLVSTQLWDVDFWLHSLVVECSESSKPT